MNPLTHVLLLQDLPHSQPREFASRAERDPLGMRVADPLVHHRMPIMKEEFALKLPVPMLSEQDRHVQRRDPRQYVRAVVDFRMIATDTAGLASGQVIDITTRGVRTTPHETPQAWPVPDAQGVSGQWNCRCAMWACSGAVGQRGTGWCRLPVHGA